MGQVKKEVSRTGEVTSLDNYRFLHNTWDTGWNTLCSYSLETYFSSQKQIFLATNMH